MTWKSLSAHLEQAVASGVCPGGVVAIGHRAKVVATLPFGHTQTTPTLGKPVCADTIYDIASLTKPVTAALAMRWVAAGRLALDEPATRHVPALPAAPAITIGQLLGHAAGFPAHVRFYERLRAGDLANAATAREALTAMAAATPLDRAPGARAVYSDIGYVLLGSVLEAIGGARLDRLFESELLAPLGMDSTRFVDLEAKSSAGHGETFAGRDVAATEVCPVRGLLVGEVHDENAHAAGGICGHAGLFSTAGDLARFAWEVCAAEQGQGTLLEPSVVRQFLSQSAAPGTSWRLGWDTPSPVAGESHAGDGWPRAGVGHLGYTGCSMWLAPASQSFAILLTNRVHPRRDGQGIRELRRHVMDEIAAHLRV